MRCEWGERDVVARPGFRYVVQMRIYLLSFSVSIFVFVGTLFVGTPLSHASDVFPDAAKTRPLKVGSTIPSARVQPIEGASVDLAELAAESGLLLVFYRGGW